MIHQERVITYKKLDQTVMSTSGDIIYWMQAAQRTIDNHALAYAIDLANAYNKKLRVVFVLVPDFPSANTRHYHFMLEGLKAVDESLQKMGVTFEMHFGNPIAVLTEVVVGIAALIMDDAYLPYERHMKNEIISKTDCPVVMVQTNLLIPVKEAYPRSAYGAYVIRPKINKLFKYYNVPLVERKLNNTINRERLADYLFDVKWLKEAGHLTCEHLVPSNRFKGGTGEALKQMNQFIKNKLSRYDDESNDPSLDITSHMSPYLHFGQISPLTLLQMMGEQGGNSDAYVEQVIVRRELSFNMVFYEPKFANNVYSVLPEWAITTLTEHTDDIREVIYSRDAFENATTHDPFWNAAQIQLKKEGILHNYMRMYWGKKVIEWSRTPEDAYELLLYLNDKYALDGRDPNGYTGILWCFGKHDRPWRERPIFGKVRYMNDKGLQRKFNMTSYLERYH